VENGWYERRFDVVVSGLRSAVPDVVCLQETQRDQADEIGKAIGLHTCAFVSYGRELETTSLSQGGVAILSRWLIRRLHNRKLPHPPGHPIGTRVALFASFETSSGERDLHVATTHLSWRPEEADIRLAQTRIFLSEIAVLESARDSRILLCGDFNATESEQAVQLLKEGFLDSFRVKNPDSPGLTWETANPLTVDATRLPDRRIDYIFVSRGARVLSSEVILSAPRPVFASDHFGVLSEVEW
jgi:endonuclease/exonuclease/phosphatase family metal-dependent hydrolase